MNPVLPALELKGLSKCHGATEVLRGLSLLVRPGERIGIIGPNGAGKSTLFDLISGAQAPSAGQILLGGQRIDGLSPFRISRLGLGRSFQVSQVFPSLSVADNLRCGVLWRLGYRYRFWARLRAGSDVDAEVDALLARVRLQGRRDTPARQLSYAEQRALELGITLAGDPQLMLLDEPTAGMNQSESRHVVALIREVTQGKTLLMVEHDMAVVFGLAERIAVLVQGTLLAFDTPQAIRANRQVQQAYLGTLPGL